MAMIWETDEGAQWVAHAGPENVGQKGEHGFDNDPVKVAHVLKEWTILARKFDYEVVACVEKIAPRQGEGMRSAAKFAGSMWLVQGILAALDVPCTMVTPSVWKRKMRLRADKGQSLAMARALFPKRAWAIKHKKDHNYAEAVLIAEYGRLDHTKQD